MSRAELALLQPTLGTVEPECRRPIIRKSELSTTDSNNLYSSHRTESLRRRSACLFSPRPTLTIKSVPAATTEERAGQPQNERSLCSGNPEYLRQFRRINDSLDRIETLLNSWGGISHQPNSPMHRTHLHNPPAKETKELIDRYVLRSDPLHSIPSLF